MRVSQIILMYPLILLLRTMSIMKYIIGFVLSILVLNVSAQNDPIEIIGEIIDSETKEPVPFVHIINHSTDEGTASNTEGRFWIKINPSDTLLFSAIGFETYQFVVNEEVPSQKILLTIELKESTLELEAVKIFAYRNEAALKRAILDTKVPLQEEKKYIELPGFNYGPKKEWKNSALSSPITAIANVFSKEVKEQKKLASTVREYNSFRNTQAKYNEAVVKEITGLPDDKIEDFMKFCVIDPDYLVRATEYEVAVVIHRCLDDFNKIEEQEKSPSEN